MSDTAYSGGVEEKKHKKQIVHLETISRNLTSSPSLLPFQKTKKKENKEANKQTSKQASFPSPTFIAQVFFVCVVLFCVPCNPCLMTPSHHITLEAGRQAGFPRLAEPT